MAGSDPNFSAADFRTNIRFVMTMASPGAVQDRPTFRWTTDHTYTYEDPRKRPYDWTSAPVTTASHADVQVPVVVQFQERGPDGSPVGEFDASRCVLTLLDEDYEKIKGADLVLLRQEEYEIDLVGPPTGLFDVTIYEIFAHARDAR